MEYRLSEFALLIHVEKGKKGTSHVKTIQKLHYSVNL